MEKLPLEGPGSPCFHSKITDERLTVPQVIFFDPGSLLGKFLLSKELGASHRQGFYSFHTLLFRLYSNVAICTSTSHLNICQTVKALLLAMCLICLLLPEGRRGFLVFQLGEVSIYEVCTSKNYSNCTW